MSQTVTLRSSTDHDRELLIRIYEASRETELSMTNWDERMRRSFCELQLEAQTRHYLEVYPNAEHSIILSNGEAVGRLYVDHGKDQIAILDITVLPQYRNKGIASLIVRGLKDEAKLTEKPLRIFIESFNPSQKLFRELGFEAVTQEGVNFRFEWHPGD